MRNCQFFTVLVAVFLCGPVRAEDHPNIVVILVDDMGYGDVGAFNPKSKVATPNIDGLAATGMKFTNAHASGPLCHMSRYGLLTGEYPFRTNVNRWNTEPLIDDEQMTVASLLGDNGYATAMVGKWHCGFVEKAKGEEDYTGVLKGGPADRGFDSFFGIRASTDIPPYFYIDGNRAVMPPSGHIEARDSVAAGWTSIQGEFWREGGIADDLKLPDVLPRFTDEAIAVIEQRDAEKPLFLYLAHPAPHTPWLPAEEYRGKSGAGMYGDFLMMVDAEIGRVLGALDKEGMTEDTLVIFSSDNGPVWYSQDVEKFGHDAVGGLRGMKADAWEGGHRMPFIARWPGRVSGQSSNGALISFVDLLATFADIVGADLPEKAGLDSFSFLPHLTTGKLGKDSRRREELALKSGRGTMTYTRGPWKIIDGLGSGGFSQPSKEKPEKNGPRGQLYNLNEDRGEKNNLWLEKPDIVESMRARMKKIVDAGRSR
jgi:arylsulfatase A-like enzyme